MEFTNDYPHDPDFPYLVISASHGLVAKFKNPSEADALKKMGGVSYGVATTIRPGVPEEFNLGHSPYYAPRKLEDGMWISGSDRIPEERPVRDHIGDATVTTRAQLEAELQAERSRSDEVMEKITYLRDGCLNMSAEELVQKITAVGSAEWKMGHYVNPLLEKEREKAVQAQRQKQNADEFITELREILLSGDTDSLRQALDLLVNYEESTI